MNLNAARLRVDDINDIRALAAARFTTKSIAAAYYVVPRSIRNVIHGRGWGHVQHEQVPLPHLPLDRAQKLVLLSPGKLNVEQQAVIEQYAQTLAGRDDPLTRQVYVNILLKLWKPRHTRRGRKRRESANAIAAEAVAAGPAEAARGSSSSSCSSVGWG